MLDLVAVEEESGVRLVFEVKLEVRVILVDVEGKSADDPRLRLRPLEVVVSLLVGGALMDSCEVMPLLFSKRLFSFRPIILAIDH